MLVILTCIDLKEIIPLRQEVLHPDGPVSRVIYKTDEHPEALHLGVRDEEGRLVACGSLLPEDDEGNFSEVKNRIRGMAVDEGFRGKGLGQTILDKMLEHIKENQISYTWCNARVAVLPFYEKVGFVKVGETFDVPGSGPHYKMILTSSVS